MVISSDGLQHNKLSVYKFMERILTKLKEKASIPSISEVHVVSDGASSQFKQRFLFSTTTTTGKDPTAWT